MATFSLAVACFISVLEFQKHLLGEAMWDELRDAHVRITLDMLWSFQESFRDHGWLHLATQLDTLIETF